MRVVIVICQHCDAEFSATSRRFKFCPDCKRLLRREQCRQKTARYREKNREHTRAAVRSWRKNNTDYDRKRYTAETEFREKKKFRAKQYYKNHLEERRQYFCEWAKKYPEKVASANAKKRDREYIDHEIVKRVFKRFKGQCVYCGSRERSTLEHLTPLSRGGTNDEHNLAVACHRCNCMKGSKMPLEFFIYLEDIT